MYAFGLAALVVMAITIACGEPERAAPPPTVTPTIKPTETPASTPTPTEAENLISSFEDQIYEKVQEQSSSCYVNRDIDGTIREFSTRSINYLRTYWKSPNLTESNVRSIINYLESQRGRHERLCTDKRGDGIPEVKNVSDIIKFYDNGLDEIIREGRNCELVERTEKLSFAFSHENINYVRGVFDAPWLNRDHLLQLIAHFESEAGRYAALCNTKN